MWTSTLDLSPGRVLLTRVLGRFYPDIYFSSLSPLKVQNLPRQVLPASNWVRVRNRLAGISRNDLTAITADEDMRVAPAAMSNRHSYPGHELVGEVIEIGDEVQHLNVGDRVALRYGPNCLSMGIQQPCRSCARGNFNLCENTMRVTQHSIGGGWSEEILLHEQQLFPIPPSLNDEQAVMLESSAVALHAILRRPPQPGERVLIIGAGTVGLITLQLIRALVPQAEISVMARYSFQVEQATRLGATHIIYPHDSYTGVQRATGAQLYHGMFGNKILYGGYDVIYDTVGSKQTLHHALRWARAQATVVLAGPDLHLMNIDLTPIWYQEVNLIGSAAHGIEAWPVGTNQRRSTFGIVTELMENGSIHPEQLITHHFALDNYRHALSTARQKAQSRAIKVVFDYSLLPASVVPNVRAAARSRRPATAGKAGSAALTGSFANNQNQTAQPRPRPTGPVREPETERRPVPQPTAIQTTPPVAPLDEDALLKAMKYANEGSDDDTATALPALSKHMRAVQRKTAQTNYNAVPTTRSTPQVTPVPPVSRMGEETTAAPISTRESLDDIASFYAGPVPQFKPAANETNTPEPVERQSNQADMAAAESPDPAVEQPTVLEADAPTQHEEASFAPETDAQSQASSHEMPAMTAPEEADAPIQEVPVTHLTAEDYGTEVTESVVEDSETSDTPAWEETTESTQSDEMAAEADNEASESPIPDKTESSETKSKAKTFPFVDETATVIQARPRPRKKR